MRSCPRLFISAALMKAAWAAARGQETCHAKPTARKTSVLLQQGQMKFKKVAKLDDDVPKDTITFPVPLMHQKKEDVIESTFAVPMEGNLQVGVHWIWKRTAGDMDEFFSGSDTSRFPTVSVALNGEPQRVGHVWVFDNKHSLRHFRTWLPTISAGLGPVTITTKVVLLEDEMGIDEFSGEVTASMSVAYSTCKFCKLCIKEHAEHDPLGSNSTLQLQCLHGTLQTKVCEDWHKCLVEKGVILDELIALLSAAVSDFPDDNATKEAPICVDQDPVKCQDIAQKGLCDEYPDNIEFCAKSCKPECKATCTDYFPDCPAVAAKGGCNESFFQAACPLSCGSCQAPGLAQTAAHTGSAMELAVTGQEGCINPKFKNTESWYCLCIDEMQKACSEIKEMSDIQNYDEAKCLQAMGCYDAFNQVCPDWKEERVKGKRATRCGKLKVYTNAIRKHQEASLVQRAGPSAIEASGGAALLDNTVSSKARQCNH